jgi:uncharacterized protein DUF2817
VNALTAFSPDYVTARQRFREAAKHLGWSLESYPIEAPDPVGQELTIDAAITPARDTARAVVVSSGLHGVEGFIGSAVQVGFLQQLAAAPGPAEPVRYVFLHGLNPYGFACLRRANEENVDPNRNFLTDGEAFNGSPEGYAALDSLLNPQRPPSRLEPFTLKAMRAVARLGMPALKQTIAGGQFDYPRGLFFGGARPTRTNQILTAHLGRWVEGCSEVVHLDFHTGLGRWATCKLLIDSPLTERQLARLNDWFGPDSFEFCDPSLISYHVRGGFDRWCLAQNPGRDYLHLCAEFGTYGPMRVIGGLRAENQAHHWGKPADRSTLRAKERIKELFCPASPQWRTQTFRTGVSLVEKAVACLTPESSGSGKR